MRVARRCLISQNVQRRKYDPTQILHDSTGRFSEKARRPVSVIVLSQRRHTKIPGKAFSLVSSLCGVLFSLPQVRVADGSSLPFTFVGKWVCEPTQSTLTVDYACNAHAIPGSKPLTNVQIIAPVSGGVQKMETKPNATW